ncbi:hypothetical protein LSH36_669g01025 [Paralvinella palmiformis]|uniref:Uncharacterized protein n=1 Tax=Paralvinella palmiformis TaxID=53620 RepID=A0AAD9MVF7_9ANNE|nr:hypothetical protein LSH36_669g01025 [Paralvinella palmiformis]
MKPPSKQAELKLQQALRAAAIADEKLKEAGLLPEGVGRSLQDIRLRDQHDAGVGRAAAIEAIEEEGFTQTHFTSSKNTKPTSGNILPTHDNAIFGSMTLELPETDPAKILKAGPCDPKSLMHPSDDEWGVSDQPTMVEKNGCRKKLSGQQIAASDYDQE